MTNVDMRETPRTEATKTVFPNVPALLRAWRGEAGARFGRDKAVPQREIAQRMGVSERWYRALESGAQVPLTAHTLTRLADALQLGPDERTALFWYRLPEISDTTRLDSESTSLARIRRLVHGQTNCPVYAVDHTWDIVAHNDLMADWCPWIRGRGANLMRWVLQDPAAREQLAEWPEQAAAHLAQLRFTLLRYPDDPKLKELTSGILRDPWCRELWNSGPRIITYGQGKRFRISLPHVSQNELNVTALVLLPAYFPGLRVVALLTD